MEDQCLFVTYKGASQFPEMMAARYVTNGYLALKHWNKIVVDISGLQSMPTIMEVISLVSDLSSDLPPNTRVAVVVNPDQAEYAKVAERVARIESVRLTCFFGRQEAMKWVNETAENTADVAKS
jgi:hypothetical protein